MDSNRKGAIAEAELSLAAIRLGVPVLKPVAEHGRYDLAFEISGRVLRVQCKWASLDSSGAVIRVNLQSNWLSPSGYVHRTYDEGEIDLVGAYCGDLDRCYLLPEALVVGRKAILLRLAPTRNGQRACLNHAAEFEFDGAVAQLEERRAGSAKAGGSSPPSSTPSKTDVGCHQFRNHFGFYLERAAAGDVIEINRRGRPYARLGPIPAEPRAYPIGLAAA